MLKIENLQVRYRQISAVRNLSITVNEGEIVTLVGPNGAGKTSTLNSIFGHVKVTTGSIEFEGRSLLGLAPEVIVKRGIGLVPEGRHIFGTLSVAENLRLGALPVKDRRVHRTDLEKVLERFPVLKRYYKSQAALLSGGEQQQLAIARALLARPRLLLLDEPSLGLAPLVTKQVFDILAELRAEGMTILLIEQNAAAAIKLADRAYVLRAGQMAAEGGRELMKDGRLHDLYLGGVSA